jgi:hypothetical protein
VQADGSVADQHPSAPECRKRGGVEGWDEGREEKKGGIRGGEGRGEGLLRPYERFCPRMLRNVVKMWHT